MMIVDLPREFERPRHLVLAFMAGLSRAAGVSSQLYIDQLMLLMRMRIGDES